MGADPDLEAKQDRTIREQRDNIKVSHTIFDESFTLGRLGLNYDRLGHRRLK